MMKKAYDIRIKDLEDLLIILKQHANEPIVQVDIYNLTNYIRRLKRNFNNPITTLYDKLLDDADEVPFFKPFYPFSEKFAYIGRSQIELEFNTEYRHFPMSDEQVMEDAQSFFKHQGDFFYSSFMEFNSEAADHLRFISDKADTAGETLMLKSIGEAYVFVPNYSNITKFTILIHEIQHVIDFFNNPLFMENHVISETAAIFMELLASDYIAKKYKLYNDNFQRRNFLHTLIKSQATLLKDKIEMLELVNKNRHLSEDKLFAKLDESDYSEEDIAFYLEASIIQDNSYQLPYLIAIELYKIYHQNKKLALKILEDIIVNGNNYNIFSILDKYGIILNTSVLEYEDKLYKKVLS